MTRTPEPRPASPCYQRELELNITQWSTFLYTTSNNMERASRFPAVRTAASFEGEYPSDDVIIAGDPENSRYILVGAVTANRSMTYLRVIRRARKSVAIVICQPDIAPDEKPEELLVLEGNDWRELLTQYADTAAKRAAVHVDQNAPNLTGYCTWYYYYKNVTANDFFRNLDVLHKHSSSEYRAEVVQLDDGYQTFQGDWLDLAESWPCSLAETARKITTADMRAGIWLMPFSASTASRIFHEHPDWFVQNSGGAPLLSEGWSPKPDHLWATLDVTLPEVKLYLTTLFQTLRAWGFSYFKLDGLGFALQPGKRHDNSATPVSAYREGMRTIRNAVPDATILGCCPPFLASLGFVDICRVGMDTAAEWWMLSHAIRYSLDRWWMIDRWFRADPDVIVTRTDRTELTAGECRLSALAGILTGICLTSDRLDTLPSDRLALLSRAGRFRMRNPRPVRWECDTWLNIFAGTVDGQSALAIFNETEKELTIDFIAHGFPEEMEEILKPMGRLCRKITLPAHDAALLIKNMNL